MICGDSVGLGHITRTHLIAERLASRGHQVLVLASGGARFEARHERISVAGMPQLLSDAEAQAHVNGLLTAFQPDLITEDTGTRPDLRGLSGFAAPPKVLILRRMDGFGLERYRRGGSFAYYDRTLVLASAESLLSQPTVLPVTKRAMRASRRFRYFGPVYRMPTRAEVAAASARYGKRDAKLVVVSAGGGGDHGADDYCERLYHSAVEAATLLREDGLPAKFVIVAGPLFGAATPRPGPDVEVVSYEPALHALLHAADVAVIRPGANVLLEALSGPARLVLVPGHSHFEDQAHQSRILSQTSAALVASSEPADLAVACRLQLVAGPTGPRSQVPSAHRAIADALVEEAAVCDAGNRCAARDAGEVFFVLSGIAATSIPNAPFPMTAGRIGEGPISAVLDAATPTFPTVPWSVTSSVSTCRSLRIGICQPKDWTTVLPTHIDQAALDLLLLPEYDDIGGGDYLSSRRWIKHFGDLLPTVGFCLKTVSIRGRDWTELRQRSQATLSQGLLPAFLVDFHSRVLAQQLLAEILSWLRAEHLRILSPADLADRLSGDLLSPGSAAQSSLTSRMV